MTDAARISDILERIDRIQRATSGGREAFLASEVLQDAVIRNLEVIGEAAKDVSPRLRRRHPRVPWQGIARLRDLAIHPYGQVLSEEVWGIVSRELLPIRRSLSKATPDPA